MESKTVTLNVNISNMDSELEKVQKYVELLVEAKTLAEELASTDFEVSVK